MNFPLKILSGAAAAAAATSSLKTLNNDSSSSCIHAPPRPYDLWVHNTYWQTHVAASPAGNVFRLLSAFLDDRRQENPALRIIVAQKV